MSPDVAFAGQDFRVVWEQQGHELVRRLWGARVTTGGSGSAAVLSELNDVVRPARRR